MISFHRHLLKIKIITITDFIITYFMDLSTDNLKFSENVENVEIVDDDETNT